MAPDPPSPEWLEWGTEPFARAARRHQPVLLSIVASWSEACARMDRETFAQPAICDLMASTVVPVRVDADRRPDVAARYGLGAWPSTVFLGPEGALLAGGTFVDARRLIAVVRALAETFARREGELRAAALSTLAAPADLPPPAAAVDSSMPAKFAARALDEFDEARGGFGPSPWHPPGELLLLLIIHGTRHRDPRALHVAGTVLEALHSGLIDPHDGGLCRAAAGPGWQSPDTARLLDVNASLLRVAAAAHAAGVSSVAAPMARGLVAFLRERLLDREVGAFRLAQRGDAAWFAADDREPGGAPPVTNWCPVDGNARACRALLAAAEALGDPALAESAIDTLDRVVGAAYERGAGVAHVLDPRPRVRGLLADQVAVSAALLEAAAVSGRDFYVDLAEELMRSAIVKLWDARHECLADRLRSPAGGGDIGLLARPLYPLAANAEAALVLHHLAARRGDAGLAAHADAILRALGSRWVPAGLDAAPYALAVLGAGEHRE
jgi:uncharacterized protein